MEDINKAMTNKEDLRQIKLPPSKSRIFNMSKDVLLAHWQLIKFKKSSLSKSQRDLVENRVEFLLRRKDFLQEDLNNLLK